MRSPSLSINRQGFERNPTNCGRLATESTMGGFTPGGGTVTLARRMPRAMRLAGQLAARGGSPT